MAVGGRRCATGSDTLAIGDRRCVVSIGDDDSSLRDSSGGGFEPGLKHADGNSTDSADSSDGGSDSSTGGGFGDGRSENPVNSRDSSGGGSGSGLVSSARLDDDTAPRALSLIDLCRATGTRVSLP